MKAARTPAVRIVWRCLVFVVLVAPLAVFGGVAWRSAGGDIETKGVLANQIGDLLDGRLSDETVLVICLGVMVGAWMRVIWIAVVVVTCRWRGRDVRGSDRFMFRLVMRVLVLTPIVAGGATPRIGALATSSAIEIEREPEGILREVTTRNALLVSIVVAVGVAWHLRQRRVADLRSSTSLSVDADSSRFESDVVRSGSDQVLAHLELAVRSLVSAGRRDFRWLVQHPSELVHVECPARGVDPAPWTRVSNDVLVLDVRGTVEELERIASTTQTLLPVLLPIGTTEAGSIWLNLDEAGSFFVEGRHESADAVWEGLRQSLALSTLHTSVNLIGCADDELFGRRQLVTRDDANADDIARILHSNESPSVILLSHGSRREFHIRGIDRSGSSDCGLVMRNDAWYLLPLQRRIEPTMCTDDDRRTLIDLMGSTTPTIECAGRAFPTRGHEVEGREELGDRFRHHEIDRMMSEMSFIVRTMGRPAVESVSSFDRRRVQFERSKSEELVVWLTLHPHRQHRSSARAEMWSVPVKDATFSNITSDVRRSLTVHETPPRDEQWLGVTMNDDLPLNPRVVSDMAVLERCLGYARRCPEDDGLGVLLFGLEFVRGCPLEGSRYLWHDAAGITTEIAMLVVRAALLCCEMALECGDVESLYRSSAKGLAAVPGHESLVAIRMRQHAENADRASLAIEWESYCRSLINDEWGDSQPSPQMIDLWRSLSGGRHRSA